ncbi:protein timeless-like [Glandiceps talaboti]
MEWHIMTGDDGLNAISSNLGYYMGNVYVVSDSCEESLEEVLTNIQYEDKRKRNVRHSIAISQLIKTDLIPIIIFADNDPTIFSLCIRILAKLSTPIEFLDGGNLWKENESPLRELQNMVYDLKKSLCDQRVAESIVTEIKQILEDFAGDAMPQMQIDTIQSSLVLLGNILRSQHDKSNNGNQCKGHHEQIIRNFLEEGFSQVIVSLCKRPELKQWMTSILHLLCVIFKEKPVDLFIQSLAEDKRKSMSYAMWSNNSESAMSCSSSDKDNSIEDAITEQLRHKVKLSEEEGATSATETATVNVVNDDRENSESESDNDSRQSDDGQSTLSYDSSNSSWDSDYSSLLQDLAYAFTRNGLNRCSMEFKATNRGICQVEYTYLHWAIGYYLQFSQVSVLQLQDISETVSAGMISCLSYLTLRTFEIYACAQKPEQADVFFSRLCILAKAVREMFTTLSRYLADNGRSDIAQENRNTAMQIIRQIMQCSNVYNMYILLIRKYNPDTETVEYLRDLVMGNTELLLMTQHVLNEDQDVSSFQIKAHVEKFASFEVMASYAHLLSKFADNDPVVNEATLTMMFHVVADVNKIETLYQTSILTTFANMWEVNFCLSQESENLIDFVVQRFCEVAKDDMGKCAHILTKAENKLATRSKEKSKAVNDNKLLQDRVINGPRDLKPAVTPIHELVETALGQTLYGCLQMCFDEGYVKQMESLKSLFLEVCYARLNCPKDAIPEPLAYFYSLENKSVPFVVWADEDETAFRDPIFKKTLQFLGLHSPEDGNRLFFSIPSFWTAEMCFRRAKELGPIRQDELKFAITEEGQLLPEHTKSDMHFPEDKMKKPSESRLVPGTTKQLPSTMWMYNVAKCNEALSKLKPSDC